MRLREDTRRKAFGCLVCGASYYAKGTMTSGGVAGGDSIMTCNNLGDGIFQHCPQRQNIVGIHSPL